MTLLSSCFGNGLSGGNGNTIFVNADSTIFGFDSTSRLTLKTNSIDERFINSSTFGNGLSGGNGTKPSLNIDPTYFGYTALSSLTLLSSSITHKNIDFSSLGDGLVGGSGNLIRLKVKENLFNFELGKLQLSANSVTEKYINSNAFAYGLVGGNNQKIGINRTSNFTFTSSNELELSNTLSYSSNTATISSITDNTNLISLSSGISFPRISWDEFGRITNINTSIVEVLTGIGSPTTVNADDIFTGYVTEGDQSGANITTFTAKDHNNNTYTLSSAGFLAFSSENTSLSGQKLKRFAIPVFAY